MNAKVSSDSNNEPSEFELKRTAGEIVGIIINGTHECARVSEMTERVLAILRKISERSSGHHPRSSGFISRPACCAGCKDTSREMWCAECIASDFLDG